jgi:hypothetical protein
MWGLAALCAAGGFFMLATGFIALWKVTREKR